MRCRFCGSTSLHEDKQHKNFSTGKAVAGAVAFGVVGAAAGFIGKDQKGYRCGACGAFMETPMDSLTEMSVDSAIREAEEGRSRAMFDYYKKQYANITANIPVKADSAQGAAPSAPVEREIVYVPVNEDKKEQGEAVKRSYRAGLWLPDCPVYVESVTIKTDLGGDRLSLKAWNQSDKKIRSVYFNVKVFDDTGDEVSACKCVYQGLSVGTGGRLPEEKEFSLNTELAYRVELFCEKAAFEGDDVWRGAEDEKPVVLPDQPALSEETFPRLKYADSLYAKQRRDILNMKEALSDAEYLSKIHRIKENAKNIYMPMRGDGFWLCDCGVPVRDGEKCPNCGDTWENVERAFSQTHLLELQREVVKKRAAERAEGLAERLDEIKERQRQAEEERKLQAERERQRRERELEEQKRRTYDEACGLMRTDTIDALGKAITAFRGISDYKDSKDLSAKCKDRIDELKEEERKANQAKYDEAMELSKSEDKNKLNQAIGILQGLSSFGDSPAQLKKTQDKLDAIIRAEKAAKAAKTKKTAIIIAVIAVVAAIVVFLLINVIIPQNKYNKAMEQYEAGEYVAAMAGFEELGNYKDSVEKKVSAEVAELSKAQVGDIVIFGSYEQDNDTSNGKERIEWRVLAKEDGKMLLISEYALDCKPYNSSGVSVTWEKSYIRKWINDSFINEAFVSEEQMVIQDTKVMADANPRYSTTAGNNTTDKVFLISINEANTYFGSEVERQCKATAYAVNNGAYATNSGSGNCIWWLRTQGQTTIDAVNVTYYGGINLPGSIVATKNYAVRPAMWVSIE
ncbi:MAG: hypothetical protein IJG50_09360 [Clostridia bacterium]|nr:hypothetical protein [Clostridia bacterium]